MSEQEKFKVACLEAFIASSRIIRSFQSQGKTIGQVKTKSDDTLLTVADHQSEDAIFMIMRRHFPDVPIIREESGLSQGSNSNRQIWVDPLDGTGPFSYGALTSTVIFALYDTINKTLISVVIGEPAGLRIWSATKGHGCELTILNNDYTVAMITPRKVWDGPMSSSNAVFLDFTASFKRDKGTREILNDQQAGKLLQLLATKVRLQLYGSNGEHHGLLANGNDKVVGGFTLAMGGCWDAAGALLIIEAGGCCSAFKVIDGQLIKCDPLDPVSYDVLVYANNEENLGILAGYLKTAFYNK